MSENDGEDALRIDAGKSVCIRVADSRVQNLDADFAGPAHRGNQ